ncbi:hypothetical protein C8Q79DRAFT_923150 [Trametes meyenii]|nr:hypothetical protein C8Q79DRAFT_923150 [Trametes meyenii]
MDTPRDRSGPRRAPAWTRTLVGNPVSFSSSRTGDQIETRRTTSSRNVQVKAVPSHRDVTEASPTVARSAYLAAGVHTRQQSFYQEQPENVSGSFFNINPTTNYSRQHDRYLTVSGNDSSVPGLVSKGKARDVQSIQDTLREFFLPWWSILPYMTYPYGLASLVESLEIRDDPLWTQVVRAGIMLVACVEDLRERREGNRSSRIIDVQTSRRSKEAWISRWIGIQPLRRVLGLSHADILEPSIMHRPHDALPSEWSAFWNDARGLVFGMLIEVKHLRPSDPVVEPLSPSVMPIAVWRQWTGDVLWSFHQMIHLATEHEDMVFQVMVQSRNIPPPLDPGPSSRGFGERAERLRPYVSRNPALAELPNASDIDMPFRSDAATDTSQRSPKVYSRKRLFDEDGEVPQSQSKRVKTQRAVSPRPRRVHDRTAPTDQRLQRRWEQDEQDVIVMDIAHPM